MSHAHLRFLTALTRAPQRVTPDHLFNLFSLYGDPLKVKILHNRRDSALIQMATPAQAYAISRHSLSSIFSFLFLSISLSLSLYSLLC
jgi:hypothetical protein